MLKAKWIDYKEQLAERSPDLDRLRTALRWAIFSVHSPIKLHERDFTRYQWGRRLPTYLAGSRKRALADAESFCDRLDWAAFVKLPLADKLDAIVDNVHGLSYAKTAFALDVAQIANIACIDVWIARSRLGMKQAPSWRNVDHYLETVKRAFGCVEGSGTAQWYEFHRLVPAFRQTNHAIVFQAMGVETERQLTLWT